MRGLIRKDVYQYIAYCKMYALIVVLFLVLGIVSWQDNSFMLFYPAMILGMLPMTLMAYEEKEKWDAYSRLLPYRISWLVSVKYLAVLVLNMVFFLVIMGSIFLSVYMKTPQGAPDAVGVGGISLWGIAAMLISVGLLGPAFLYPFCFRIGVEKARVVRIVYIVLCFAAVGMFNSLIGEADGSLRLLQEPAGAAIIVLISIILFLLSWGLAIKWYGEKEF